MSARADHSGWRKGAFRRMSSRDMPPSRMITLDILVTVNLGICTQSADTMLEHCYDWMSSFARPQIMRIHSTDVVLQALISRHDVNLHRNY